MGKSFFISYHQSDRAWAEWIGWQIEAIGQQVILKAWDFRPGSNFTLLTDRAVQEAQQTLLLLSPDALKDPEAQAIWSALYYPNEVVKLKTLIPVKVLACEPAGLLRSRSTIDLTYLSEEEARQTLLQGLDPNRQKPEEAPIYPGRHFGVKPTFPEEMSHPPLEEMGRVINVYLSDTNFVHSIEWDRQGKRIASGGGDNIIRIWEPMTGEEYLAYQGHTKLPTTQIWKLSWSPDGKYLASGGFSQKVRVWSTKTGQDIHLHNSSGIALLLETLTVAWSPTAMRIASACSAKYANQGVEIWDALSGGNRISYTANMPGAGFPAHITALSWSPDGNYIASAGNDRRARQGGIPIIGGYKMTTQIWHAGTKEMVSTHNAGSSWIYNLSWSPDGKYMASTESDKTIQVWDARTGENRVIYRGHSKEVRTVAWSPDGSQIASGGNDKTVHLWNPETGSRHYIYRGHMDSIICLAWSPDGHYLASAGNDKTVQIWRAG
jgi:WD40 repeat protein